MGEGHIYLGQLEIGHLESRGRFYRWIDPIWMEARRFESRDSRGRLHQRTGSEECLPPLVDGSRGDLLAPGGPLRNPLVLPSSSSSSSSVPPARSHPKGVRPVGDAKVGKYRPLGGPLILPGLSLAFLIFGTTCEVSPEGGSTCRGCERREVWRCDFLRHTEMTPEESQL